MNFFVLRLKKSGVEIKQQTVNDFAPLISQYNAVFNCSGLGARYLCNDTEILPVRGQIVQVCL